MKARRLGLVVAFVGLSCAGVAAAHDFDPGVLAIVEERGSGSRTHRFKLTQPTNTRGAGSGVRVRFPAGCTVDEGAHTLACPAAAFAGEMGLDGVGTGSGRTRVIVSLTTRDGRVAERIVEDDAPFVLAPTSATPHAEAPRAFFSWVTLGAGHLLGGPDHLAFLVGLLALVATRRDLLLAITAFSLGHAISLGLSVTGVLAVPVAPTEALIALSVVLVAREALVRVDLAAERPAGGPSSNPPTSLLRRAPFLVSALFGLVHGLGFASALGDKGFPREGLAAALFAFHLGIEAAQLLLVAFVGLFSWLLVARARDLAASIRAAALYAIGTGGAFWCCERLLTVWRG